MRQKKTNELFTLRVKVSEEGGNVTASLNCEKEGKGGEVVLLETSELCIAYSIMMGVTDELADYLAVRLYAEGKTPDEAFAKLMNPDKEKEGGEK